MKLIKILRTAIIIFVIVFAVTFVFLFFQGKAIIAGQLEKLTHKKVSINYVGLTLPFNLEIKNLDIPGLARVEYASISPSIPGLLSGKIVLNDIKLINPQLVYVKTADNTKTGEAPVNLNTNVNTAVAASAVQPESIPQSKSEAKKDKSLRLIIKNLSIKDGKIDFFDRTLPGDGIKITFKDINFHLTNLYIYPKSAVTDFELKARIPWLEGEEEGKIEAKGWVNLFKKDMQATLKIADIDGVYLYPYYSQFVDLEKTRIEKAKLNVTSDIKSVNGNLTAPCHLELSDVVFKRPQSEGEEDKTQKIVSAVMDMFSAFSKTNKFIFNLTYKGKLPSFY